MSRHEPHELEPHRLANRITELETMLTHLQRTLETLDEVVLQQHQRMDQLERRMGRLQYLAERLVQDRGEAETRHPEDERPPHY